MQKCVSDVIKMKEELENSKLEPTFIEINNHRKVLFGAKSYPNNFKFSSTPQSKLKNSETKLPHKTPSVFENESSVSFQSSKSSQRFHLEPERRQKSNSLDSDNAGESDLNCFAQIRHQLATPPKEFSQTLFSQSSPIHSHPFKANTSNKFYQTLPSSTQTKSIKAVSHPELALQEKEKFLSEKFVKKSNKTEVLTKTPSNHKTIIAQSITEEDIHLQNCKESFFYIPSVLVRKVILNLLSNVKNLDEIYKSQKLEIFKSTIRELEDNIAKLREILSPSTEDSFLNASLVVTLLLESWFFPGYSLFWSQGDIKYENLCALSGSTAIYNSSLVLKTIAHLIMGSEKDVINGLGILEKQLECEMTSHRYFAAYALVDLIYLYCEMAELEIPESYLGLRQDIAQDCNFDPKKISTATQLCKHTFECALLFSNTIPAALPFISLNFIKGLFNNSCSEIKLEIIPALSVGPSIKFFSEELSRHVKNISCLMFELAFSKIKKCSSYKKTELKNVHLITSPDFFKCFSVLKLNWGSEGFKFRYLTLTKSCVYLLKVAPVRKELIKTDKRVC